MSSEFRLEQGSLEHMMKQPSELRYAVFCDLILRGSQNVECETRIRLGHIGDYVNYENAKIGALTHPHPALIRFYPDFETVRPTEDFQKDLIRNRTQA